MKMSARSKQHRCHSRAGGNPCKTAVIPAQAGIHDLSGVDFDLVVLKLDDRGSAQNFQQDSDAFAGDALNQAFDATKGGVFEAHSLAGFEVAELLQSGMVTVLFELTNALHEVVLKHGRLKAETHDGGDAFGAAHRRDALLGLAGPEQDVAREHGFKQRDRPLFCFFELFVEWQIGLKGLLLKVDLGNLLLAGFGVGEIPTIGWRGVAKQRVWGERVLGHWCFLTVSHLNFEYRNTLPRMNAIKKQSPACAGLLCVNQQEQRLNQSRG